MRAQLKTSALVEERPFDLSANASVDGTRRVALMTLDEIQSATRSLTNHACTSVVSGARQHVLGDLMVPSKTGTQ